MQFMWGDEHVSMFVVVISVYAYIKASSCTLQMYTNFICQLNLKLEKENAILH